MLISQTQFNPGVAESIILARIDEFANNSCDATNTFPRSHSAELAREQRATLGRIPELIDFVEKEFGVSMSERDLGDGKLESLRELAHFVATNQPFAVG